MMASVPCRLSHLEKIDIHSENALDREVLLTQLEKVDREFLALHCRTLVENGTPIACGGVWPIWRGVGRAWSLLTPRALECRLTLHREVKQELDRLESVFNYGRIEAHIRDGHEAAHEWIEVLGFTWEALMQNYGLGGVDDFHLYARLRDVRSDCT